MDVVKLGSRQIFGMKKETLMKRVLRYFEQTQQAAEVVEYLVAILFRHALCVGDFSLQPLSEMIRQIFLTAAPNGTLRRHCVYFEHFFSLEEWQTVIQRLFSSDEEYQQFTKETCLYKKLLEKKSLETHEIAEFQFDLVSIFKDANGKRHTWTLRDTKQVRSEEETAKVLGVLTTLTIFRSSGIRRFAEYVKFKSKKGCIDAEHEAVQAEPEEAVQETAVAEEQPRESKPTSKAAASAASKTAHAQSSRGSESNTLTRKETDTTSPLSSDTPPTQSKEKEPSAESSESKSSKKTKISSEKLDTSDKHYGKSKEKIQEERDKRKWKNRVNKFLGRKK
ncbi:hypothetical protein [Candidatus Enterococcus murrayae]|uniref:Uncharacterized protein n=1 Tax=Candidatus Enterococcus murrayae TaxID=2815321 RepID=A0ABS3HIC3_9ENTE|nr:hypothetical protein [Enterococcus sp. MJM16]MBO0453204.1 hypothetical protein [Enterococcus sp. MJM16]